MNRKRIAEELVGVAKELTSGSMEKESAEYAETIVENIQKKEKQTFEKMAEENPKKLMWTVVAILGTFRGGKSNANYNKRKKYLPDSEPSQEWKDWWFNLTDARQATVARKALAKVGGIDSKTMR